MHIELFQYFGLDWIATALSLYGVDSISKKRKVGFIILALANILWFFIGIGAGSIAMLFSNIVFGYMNIKGHKRWSLDEQRVLP